MKLSFLKSTIQPEEGLNLFYEEPQNDRWFKFDRYPRAVVRRIVRGRPQVLGLGRVFLNLCAGLDRLQVRYTVNDYARLRRRPTDVACVLGKPHVLDRIPRETPIIFGPAGYDHPIEAPTLLDDRNILAVVVACEWARQMFAVHWHEKVHAWPVGIDTDLWAPAAENEKDIDVLVYDKIRCHLARDHAAVRDPILDNLRNTGLRVATIRYGRYREEQFHALLKRVRSMVFLCEHETQGIALLQTLACGVPVLAWDFGGPWQDTNYYPHRVTFGPVTSVPYWDDRCGMKFRDMPGFLESFPAFWSQVASHGFSPRSYVVENLSLESGAQHYVDLVQRLSRPRAAIARDTPP